MNQALIVTQVIISCLLVLCILLQRGQSGLGTVFGGSVMETYRTKRGAESFIFNLTIFLSVVFVATSLAIVITSA